MNSAATTKKQVLEAAKEFIESISKYLTQQFQLKKETRESVREHYDNLLEDIKTGVGVYFMS